MTDDGLSFHRGLDKLNGRVLSLAWHADENFISVGGADSTIRILNVLSGRCVQRITLDDYTPRSTLIWDLKVLNDAASTIVSADSLGKIQFWNGKHGTLVQSFEVHEADVLTLAVSSDGREVYSAGVDQKIIHLQRVKSKDSRWVKSGQVRAHAHDIRALALSEDGRIASGGVDTQLVMCPTDSFEVESCVKYLALSDSSRNFSLAADASVLMFQGSESLKFWDLRSGCGLAQFNGFSECGNDSTGSLALSDSETRIAIPDSTVQSPDSDSKKHRSMDGFESSHSDAKYQIPESMNLNVPVNFLEIKNKGALHILCSALSHDGTMVAVSNIKQLWLYKIAKDTNKVKCLKCVDIPSYRIVFSPSDSKLFLATINEGIKVVDLSGLSKSKDRFEDIESFHRRGNSSRSHCTVDLQISPDGLYLLATDFKRRLVLYSTENPDNPIKLPRLNAQPVICTFSTFQPQIILFSGSEKELFTFDIAEESLKLVGSIQCTSTFCGRSRLANPNGIVAVPNEKNLLAVYDNDCIMLVRCASNEVATQPREKAGLKRTRLFSSNPLSYQILKTRQVVLFVSALAERGLAIAEQQWSQVLKQLPPAFSRDCYGT